MTWDRDAARRQYNLPGWSAGYFDVGANGHLHALPLGEPDSPTVDLHALAHAVRDAGLAWPVLVRFTNILQGQVDRLCAAFDAAIRAHGYAAGYTALYPVKVNQQHHVVETIVQHGGARVGLEAGSKAELLAVIGIAPPGGCIMCNGYKDAEYLQIALLAQRLGHDVVIVIEKQRELALLAGLLADSGQRPQLGVRVRLSAATRGNWQNSGGDRAKFGFTAAGLLALLAQLRELGLDDCVQLLHCHPGSQISSLATLRASLQEVARTWVELRRAGLPLARVNVGGGLGVDYEGLGADSAFSADYAMQAYADAVVACFADTCHEQRLEAPSLLSESGRALTAHHAVLITDVIDSERVALRDTADAASLMPVLDDPSTCSPATAVGLYAQANTELQQLRAQFTRGELTLAQRAQGESQYFTLCRELQAILAADTDAHAHPELDRLNRQLADKYFCNLSVFQSMPDVWGIGQVFPVVPLQRLDERPDRRAILHDLTCDSDGHIERYVDSDGIDTSLPLHALHANEPYLLGFFLLGAYQEILGDMHNLFGDTDAVNVELRTDGGYRLSEPRHGDTVDELLRYVELQPARLLHRYRDKMLAAGLDAAEQQDGMHLLQGILSGTTYLENSSE